MKIRNVPKLYSLPIVRRLFIRIWKDKIRRRAFDFDSDIIESYTIHSWRSITVVGRYSEERIREANKVSGPIPPPDTHSRFAHLLTADDILSHPISLRIFCIVWWQWLRHHPEEKVVRITGWRNCITEDRSGNDRKRIAFCFWWFD